MEKSDTGIHAGLHFNPLNAELNPICHLLALLGGATIVVVSRLRVKYKHIIITVVGCFSERTRSEVLEAQIC